MNGKIPLEQIVKRFPLILLDACVMNYPSSSHKKAQPNHQRGDRLALSGWGFCAQLGKAQRFSEIRYPQLKKELDYTLEILDLVERYPTIASTPGAVGQHTLYTRHIETCIRYLLEKNRNGKPGKIENGLRELLEKQTELVRVLKGRSFLREGTEEITQFLIENDMNLPAGKKMRKKYLKIKEVDEVDANLVSNAILNDGRTAIVSTDIDISNMVRNLWNLHHKKVLPWKPNLVLPEEIEKRLHRGHLISYFLDPEKQRNSLELLASFEWGI